MKTQAAKVAPSRPRGPTPAGLGLLQRKCACGGGNSSPLTGACEGCGDRRMLGLQTKLAVNSPGDHFEQEADRVADRVMRMPDQFEHTTAPRLQRRALNAPSTSVGVGADAAPPVVHEVLDSPGRPLDAPTRTFMESRFGHDFNRVRIHADARAAESARAVDALAYTVGEDVVFGSGQYAPHAGAGRRLLAHELAHVVQQARGGSGTHLAAGASLEEEAGAAASNVIEGRGPVGVAGASPLRIARQPKGAVAPVAPTPVPAKFSYTETVLPNGKIEMRAWGTVGDAITRPGLEKKYPLPKDVGLPGYDRWHLAGPDATGAEAGIVYAPQRFNISETAVVENKVRAARAAVREQGGDVYFDFKAECRVVKDHQGVQIRELEKVVWKVEVRAAGSEKIITIVNQTASPATTPAPNTPPPTPTAPAAAPPTAAPPPTAPPTAAPKTPAPQAPPAPQTPIQSPAQPAAPTPPSAKTPTTPTPPKVGVKPAAPAETPKVTPQAVAPEVESESKPPAPSPPPAAKATPPAAAAPKASTPRIKVEAKPAFKSAQGRLKAGGGVGSFGVGLKIGLATAALDLLNAYIKSEGAALEIERQQEAKLKALQPAFEELLEQSPKKIYANISVMIMVTTTEKITTSGVEEKQNFPMVHVGVDLGTEGVAKSESHKTDQFWGGSLATSVYTHSVLLMNVEQERERLEREREQQEILERLRQAAKRREEEEKKKTQALPKEPEQPQPPRLSGPTLTPFLGPQPQAPSFLPGAPTRRGPIEEAAEVVASVRAMADTHVVRGEGLVNRIHLNRPPSDKERAEFVNIVKEWRDAVQFIKNKMIGESRGEAVVEINRIIDEQGGKLEKIRQHLEKIP